MATTLTLLGSSLLILLLLGLPKVDHGTEALRPLHSEAYAALENLKARFGRTAEPFWLLLHAPDDSTMIQQLADADQLLKTARQEKRIDSYTLPHGLWPNPEHQATNRTLLANQIPSHTTLLEIGEQAGFTERSLTFATWILDTLNTATSTPNLFLPHSPLGQWALSRLADRSTPSPYALGIIHPNPDQPNPTQLARDFTQPGKSWLTNWDALGEELLTHVQHDLKLILPAVFLLLLGTLTLTFRRTTEILLGFAALLLSLLILQAVMSLAGWTWNLMNVIALPVLLGTGVDYSIHMQLALRRHNGNLTTVHHGVGRALLLCGATTIAGFASLTLSSNSGLASLGSLCATGMIFIVLTTVFLLPAWWQLANKNQNPTQPLTPPPPQSSNENPNTPTSSKFYRAELWQLALATTRRIPRPALHALASLSMSLYWFLAPSRRHVVTQNLLPLFPQQPHTAKLKAKQLYQQFGRKLVDLWLYESQSNIEHLFGQLHGAEGFHEKLRSKKGVLLVTPHLGNWEFGGPVLARHGIRLLALTLAEPHEPLTEIRKNARAQHGIETLVVRQDPFAFLEVIRRLQNGEVVALLVDRPPKGTSTPVTLFNQTIAASVAPAEIARASGCLILPVHLVRNPTGRYDATVLPEIQYDRASLRSPTARHQLAGEILRAFENTIRQHADQWFHFVPIWSPNTSDASPRSRQ
jgi:lauroyl/myristoyl acyltransferase